jgi:hypothetical protein
LKSNSIVRYGTIGPLWGTPLILEDQTAVTGFPLTFSVEVKTTAFKYRAPSYLYTELEPRVPALTAYSSFDVFTATTQHGTAIR